MLKWTLKAQKDLELILEHIAKNFDVDLAINTVNDLIDFVEKTLSANPLAGMVLESNLLFSKIIYEGNSIYYCENPKDKKIYVVYVQPRGTDFIKNRVSKVDVA